MEIGTTLYVVDRNAWRAWLRKHHTAKREIWLVYPHKSTGKPRIPYGAAVEEALCYGWIDSTVKRIDADHAAQRFTPRRKGSNLSAMNLERVRRLIKSRKMTKAGLAVLGPLPPIGRLVVPPALRRALAKDPEAKRHFATLPAAYKRVRLGYIEEGRKHGPAEYAKRIRHFVALTRRNKRFGGWSD
jgi:uncharacterized protein YdeI (YjbR/CyaY-like superfamily)